MFVLNPSRIAPVQILAKSLLILGLAACGAPGSDSVFTRNNPRTASVDSASSTVRPRQVPRIATRVYAGYYRKSGDDSQFQPCGTRTLLEITGPPMAQLMLKERFRWNAIWEGAKLFAVFEGAIVTDSAQADSSKADSSKAGPAKRFWLVAVDSMRTWRNEDCNGMKIPRD